MSSRTSGRISTIVAIIAVLVTLPASGGEHHGKTTWPAALDRLKSLAGDWTMVDGDGSVAVTYRVTGAGSAVIETLFPGSDHEMVTMYHSDGPDVVLTHYCAAGNQPRMRAKRLEGDTLAFRFDGATNLASRSETYMRDLTITFQGPDRLRSEWTSLEGGKKAEKTVFEMQRKKS